MAKLIESLPGPLAGLFIVIICTGLVQIASGTYGYRGFAAKCEDSSSKGPSKPLASNSYSSSYDPRPPTFRRLTKCNPQCNLEEPYKIYCEKEFLKKFLQWNQELVEYFKPQLNGALFPKFNYELSVTNQKFDFLMRCIWLNHGFPKLLNSKDEIVANWSRVRVSCMDYIKDHCESVNKIFYGERDINLSNRMSEQVELCYEQELCE